MAELSKIVFGQVHCLAVCVVIGGSDHPTFTLTQVAKAVGVSSPSSVQGSVSLLAAGGFITRLPPSAKERTRWYRREASAIWMLANELYERALAAQPEVVVIPYRHGTEPLF